MTAKPADKELPVVFSFKNTGDESVVVKEIKIGCACLSAKTDKEQYAPGESGVLEAVFRLGSFTGVQRKGMTMVSRAEGATEDQRDSLMVEMSIPDVIVIEPELLRWDVGSEAEPKSFTIKVPHTDPIKIIDVSCSRDGFTVELIEKKEGREYEILLTPSSTDAAMLGVLKIQTDCIIPKHQRKLAFFSISRKSKS